MNRFSKACLVLIVVFLAIIAVQPIITPRPVLASPVYEYNAYHAMGNELEDKMNKSASYGWDIIAVTNDGDINSYTVTARKLKK